MAIREDLELSLNQAIEQLKLDIKDRDTFVKKLANDILTAQPNLTSDELKSNREVQFNLLNSVLSRFLDLKIDMKMMWDPNAKLDESKANFQKLIEIALTAVNKKIKDPHKQLTRDAIKEQAE